MSIIRNDVSQNKISRKKISNGVNLTLIPDSRLKTNFFSVSFLSNLSDETAAKNSLLHSVLNRGTVSYPDIAKINTRLQDLYDANLLSYSYKVGETHVTGFRSSGIDNSYTLDNTDVAGGMIDIVSEVIFNPVTENGIFKESYVKSEKNNLIDSIKSIINDKRRYAVKRLEEEMCKNERYGISATGSISAVEQITNESLYTHYKNMIETFPCEIYYIGKFDEAEITSKITKTFGALCKNPIKLNKTDVIKTVEEVKSIKEEQPVSQGKLTIGFRSGYTFTDADYPSFLMLREVLGGSPSSKLFMNVREKLSLCYYCSASADSSKGIMVVSSGIENKNVELAKKEILAQVEEIKKGNITDEELDAAKRSIKTSYKRITDSHGGLENYYLVRSIEGVYSNPAEVAAQVEKVSVDMIAAAAGKVTLDTIYFMEGTAN